jgi:hypothetical protein
MIGDHGNIVRDNRDCVEMMKIKGDYKTSWWMEHDSESNYAFCFVRMCMLVGIWLGIEVSTYIHGSFEWKLFHGLFGLYFVVLKIQLLGFCVWVIMLKKPTNRPNGDIIGLKMNVCVDDAHYSPW